MKQATIYTSNKVIAIPILGVSHVPNVKLPPPNGPAPENEDSLYRGFGNGLSKIDEMIFPRYDKEYKGSNVSLNTKVMI